MARQVVLMMLLGTSTIVYGIRKDEEKYDLRKGEETQELSVLIDEERQKILKAQKELSVLIDRRDANHAFADCDGDDCDGDCDDVAEACGLQTNALTSAAFFTCCSSAEWSCAEGKCKHSNRACLAAADELFNEDGEQRDCSGALDLVKYHFDHADSDLEESGLLERDLDGTVLAKGGKGGKGPELEEPELPEFEDDDDDDEDESLQQTNHSTQKEPSALIDRRDANHAYADCDGDDCDGDCDDVAEACGLQTNALTSAAFFTCCTSAEWSCAEGKCKHSNKACLAAADELFDEDGEQRDCSGALDLVKYHRDHADSDLEESIMSGILERDLDGTVLAKGGKGGKGPELEEPELPEFEDDDDDDEDESLQQMNHSMMTENKVTGSGGIN